MPFIKADIDEDLVVDGAAMRLDDATRDLPIADPITVPGKGAGWIPFQFPPRITSDTKDAKFKAVHDTFTYEPLSMWEGFGARKLNLSATYVATGETSNDVVWNPANIALVTRAWKQYFYCNAVANVFPAISLKIYDHVPKEGDPKFRVLNVNVKPSKEIIRYQGSIFPISVECSYSLEQVTRIQTPDKKRKFNITNFPDVVQQAWY